jgi:hypothetical protein
MSAPAITGSKNGIPLFERLLMFSNSMFRRSNI